MDHHLQFRKDSVRVVHDTNIPNGQGGACGFSEPLWRLKLRLCLSGRTLKFLFFVPGGAGPGRIGDLRGVLMADRRMDKRVEKRSKARFAMWESRGGGDWQCREGSVAED